jgi:hypothetical protein
VATPARSDDYDFARRPTTVDRSTDGCAHPQSGSPGRTGDAATVDEFLQRLARAVQQFRTYPPAGPICQGAADAARQALAALRDHDQLTFRVTPRELVIDEIACGRGSAIEHELARRLHNASIAEVTLDRSASVRELSRFCLGLVRCGDRTQVPTSLPELLTDQGVDRIMVRSAYRPEVLDVERPSPALAGVIEHHRQHREEIFASGGSVNHLYPPDKGWIRVDPSYSSQSLSLVDLALLADDPGVLATMLLRLTEGEDTAHATRDDALAQKFRDVAMLFAALDPRVARIMFTKLANAVLALEPDRRQALLRRTILPGLLDGRLEGTVLKDFPDVDLADSLCLLLDLETAAPELVTTALARLDLPDERHAAVAPLVERHLQDRGAKPARDTTVDAHARKLLRIDGTRTRSFAEFAAFDLAIDPQTTGVLAQIRDHIASGDSRAARLDCFWKLMRMQPNPEVVQRLFIRSARLLGELDQEGVFDQVAGWLQRFRDLVLELADARPDVAEVLSTGLANLCTPSCAARVVALAAKPDHRRAADAIVRALGPDIAPALLTVSQSPVEASAILAVQLLCDHARLLAPALATLVESSDPATSRVIARVLGLAGHGYEAVLGVQLASTDEQTVRESFRALARIGTPQAAALVCAAIERQQGWIGAAAEETLWRFPAAHAHRQARGLLGRRDFVVKQPQLAARLLDRAAQSGTDGLQGILAELAPLRYRLWNPALARLARRAHALEKR